MEVCRCVCRVVFDFVEIVCVILWNVSAIGLMVRIRPFQG